MITSFRVSRLIGGLISLFLLAALSGPATEPTAGMLSVIVRGEQSVAQATEAVTDAGGTVTQSLSIINGVAARVPAPAVDAIERDQGVAAVTVDHPITLHGGDDDDDWSADDDPRSVYNALKAVGADEYWDEGVTGAGIGVALIDTGVAPVEGLSQAGQVVHGPDLSWESQNPNTRHLDTYGHGTHMGALIAGRDADVRTDDFGKNKRFFAGIAPDAHLISLKIADAGGHTDVSQVIAAIDWVVQHRNDPGLNIRVLNLSLGMYSFHQPEHDPLAHATSIAWDRGIVVVAAGGNEGDERVGLTSPAYSQRVIAVGAADANGSDKHDRWTPLAFSARGDATRMPDLVAPGLSLTSLRVPGSNLDLTHGKRATVGNRFFRGSGTSQAAALVSGAAALVLSQHPTWTPDMVKGALMASAQPLSPDNGFTPETGNLALSLHDMAELAANPAWSAETEPTPADWGTGSLEAARGDIHLAYNGVPLVGEVDIFGTSVSTAALATSRANNLSWLGGVYNGTLMTGTGFTGAQWTGAQWTGAQWTGAQWTGAQWTGAQWTGAQWTGAQWTGSEWG